MTITRVNKNSLWALFYVSVMLVFLGSFPARAADGADRNGFIGIVNRSESQKLGSQFTFANLTMPNPFVTWPSGHGVETKKVFEDEELVVFLLVSITGSTETFYLNKKIRQFTVIEVVSANQLTQTGDKTLLKVTHGLLK